MASSLLFLFSTGLNMWGILASYFSKVNFSHCGPYYSMFAFTLPCNCYKKSLCSDKHWCTNHFAHRKCIVAEDNLSVRILYSIGNYYYMGNFFVTPYFTCTQTNLTYLSVFCFIISGIWRASHWYIIFRYIMLATKVIRGKRPQRWTRTNVRTIVCRSVDPNFQHW